MKQIKLTKDNFALIDDEDYEKVSQYKWHINCHGYAVASIWSKEEQKTKKIQMHRLIINCPNNLEIDHINMNKLDNQKSNLRLVTHSQNNMNKKKYSNNKSGFKGVSWFKPMRKWRANIFVENKQKTLGYFVDKLEAFRAYQEATKKYFGEFAHE